MAATAAGTRLTRQHQQAQLALRARAIKDWTKLWPLWDGSEASFKRLAEASIPLVRSHHELSARISLEYYRRLRSVETTKSRGTVDMAPPPITDGAIAGTLYLVGRDMTMRAIAGGHSPQAAIQNALVRTSGSMTRLILGGGRDALVQVADLDKECLGHRRITTGTCDFCAELASYGLFKDPTFRAHDHCGCVAEPAWSHVTRAIPAVAGKNKDTRSVLVDEGVLEDLPDEKPRKKKRATSSDSQPDTGGPEE